MISSFELLPPEVLEGIFEKLDFCDLNNVALVCKKWSYVAQTPRLWKDIQIEVKAQNFEEVVRMPRLAMIKKVVLATGDTVKTRITFNFDSVIKLHVY